MSDIIQLLPDSVANQIAAGEVIQRPASVIKELVENAVDAGAKTINVLVVDAGRTSIQVIDDGTGMSETDARLAFERHATSKIRQAEDLFALHTMGFRGEALASIAAVAQIELKTRLASEEVGTHLSISGSRFLSQEPCSCPVGSNFLIENIFFNVPARRKFLKSNSTEQNNIITAFIRIALVYPKITFTLHSNGVEIFNLHTSSLRQRIVDVFGKKLNQDILPVDVNTTLCRITGFVGKPESARKKGVQQFFFVNGRYMRHPYFTKAVMSAYERIVPNGEQVPYFLYFEVAPENIDVNIHPVKTEIKFENEQAIWQILAAAVKEAVGLFNDVPSIEFDVQGRPAIPVFPSSANPGTDAPHVNVNPQYNPFKATTRHSQEKALAGWEQLYDGLGQDTRAVEQQMFGDSTDMELQADENLIADKSPVHYQYKGRYIMTAVKSGLMVIDQHRAHTRILYNMYSEQCRHRQLSSQKLLFPEIVNFNPTEMLQYPKVQQELETLGFELADLGGNSFAINAVPVGLDGVNPVSLVRDMVATTALPGAGTVDDLIHSMALNLARHAAISYGEVLDNEAMDRLVNQLFTCENVNYTPDGKKILSILKQDVIDQLFR